jgi:Glycosyl hydrolase-like 10
MDAAAAFGVDRITVCAKMDEEGDWLTPSIASGEVFYASAIAPTAGGFEAFDVLQAAVEEGHARGIQVLAWLPQFHDVQAGRKHPDWRMQARVDGVVADHPLFLDPGDAEARAYERSIVLEVANTYDVDGIVIDWVRYDGWAMDLGEASRSAFGAMTGIDPLTIDFAVDSDARRAWNSYRAKIIESHVREVGAALEVAQPAMSYGVFVLPPDFAETSQDVAQFADALDFVAPMLYFDDWSYPPSWVYESSLPLVRSKAAGRTQIIPTLDEDWTDAQNEEVVGGIRRSAPETRELAWFAFGEWDRELVERLTRASICRVP